MAVFNIANGESGASVRAKLNNKLGVIIDCKADFSATGSGGPDDTAAIQAAFDAAFGTWAAPHGSGSGQSESYANRPVFFPAGNYVVSCVQTSVTGVSSGAGGAIKLAVTSAGPWATGDLLYVSGTGGGADGGWIVTVNDSTHITLNNSTFTSGYTNGTVTAPALRLRSVFGGWIFGAGRANVNIHCVTSGGVCLATNGCAHMDFDRLSFSSTGGLGTGSIALDLNWDGTGSVALNANGFTSVNFGAELGVQIGALGSMGSENVFVNCNFTNCAAIGLVTRNFNALDQTIIGGGASGCGTAFKAITGSIGPIIQVGFSGNTVYDIDIQANDTVSVTNCRTESANFINAASGTFTISSCEQTSNLAGTFIDNLNGSCVITACQSKVGKIKGNGGKLDIRACDFDLAQVTVNNATNNGSGLVRLGLLNSDGAAYVTGDTIVVAGLVGTGGLTAAANGTFIAANVTATTIDLTGSTFPGGGTYTSGGQIAPGPNQYLNGYSGACATEYARDMCITKTAAYTIPRGFSGAQYDNTGAAGTVVFTLPTLADTDGPVGIRGTKFGFYVGAAQTLQLKATNGMVIRNGASTSSANGTASNATIGSYIEIEAKSTSEWVCKSTPVGTWTLA